MRENWENSDEMGKSEIVNATMFQLRGTFLHWPPLSDIFHSQTQQHQLDEVSVEKRANINSMTKWCKIDAQATSPTLIYWMCA